MLVQHFLDDSAKRFPNKTAVISGDRRIAYKDINENANLLAASLISLGIKRQDRVIIFLDNSIEAVISIFAILKAGGIFIVLNPSMKSKKLRYILNDSGSKILITQIDKKQTIDDSVSNAEALEKIIWNHGKKECVNSKRSISWHTIFSSPMKVPTKFFPPQIDLDLATIIYTSGSTGDPKGVMSAHCNVVAAAKSITTYLRNDEKDIIINVLPISFDYGLYQVLMAFLFGGTVVLEKSFTYPYKTIELMAKERVTGFPIVPTMVPILLRIKDLSVFELNSLRYISNTAAALPVTYIKQLQKMFDETDIFSMYGLTECKRVSYLPPEDLDKKPGSVGIPMPNEEVLILDKEGIEVGPNTIGELVVRGSNVMQGYWNAPEESARVFREGRYKGERLLYSGDFFKKDNDGYLYFIARKDDMIKIKGERVSPKEIEDRLHEMEGVSEVAVVGVRDDIMGNAIKAFIVLEKKGELTRRDVIKYCMKNLEPFMIPKHIEFMVCFPKSPSGKIDKKELRVFCHKN
jgi:amino acid adenylation domain-containing protein